MIQQVAVVIPLYKTDLTPFERFSLDRSYREFKDYPIIAVHPGGLDLTMVKEDYPRMEAIALPAHFFAGIEGYNRLMMSTDFYALFLDRFEYILICQTDVYIFKGKELTDWCNKGYDYVGAPWVKRSCYDNPLLGLWMKYDQWNNHRKGTRCRQDFWGKVGNGGLSLRKVKPHYDATISMKECIDHYLTFSGPFYAEDLFWASEPKEFKYPAWQEALLFAFDKDPDYCYKLTKKQLPFGCHALHKGRSADFWMPILGFMPYSKRQSRYK